MSRTGWAKSERETGNVSIAPEEVGAHSWLRLQSQRAAAVIVYPQLRLLC